MAGNDKTVHLRARRPCPICARPARHKYHPFCSGRCADIDLHRWLGGHYGIPAAEPPDFVETAQPPERDDENDM